MRRRTFVAALGGAALSFPLAARAAATMPVIGFLHSGSPEQNVDRLAAFVAGLREAGFVEGRNVAIEYRWASGQSDRIPALLDDLVRRQVAVIAAASTPTAIAAKAAPASIPVVFVAGIDPVTLGLVAGWDRPGGNLTGVTSMIAELSAKRFWLARELAPQAARYFALVNPTTPLGDTFAKEVESNAAPLGIKLEVINVASDGELEAAFARVPQDADSFLLFGPDAFLYTRRARIAALTARYRLPAIFDVRDYVAAGGLASYGVDFLSVLKLAGGYTGRILNGEKPSDLPVMRSAKVEMAINIKTAKALGIKVPPTLLALADDVIE